MRYTAGLSHAIMVPASDKVSTMRQLVCKTGQAGTATQAAASLEEEFSIGISGRKLYPAASPTWKGSVRGMEAYPLLGRFDAKRLRWGLGKTQRRVR